MNASTVEAGRIRDTALVISISSAVHASLPRD